MARPSKASREQIVRRQAEVLRLKLDECLNFRQIGERLGISHTQAHRDFNAALKDMVPAEEAAAARRAELLKADLLEQEVRRLLDIDQPMVSFGKIVRDDVGRPIVDVRPKLAAVDRIMAVRRYRAELLGIRFATPVTQITPDVIRAEIDVQARVLNISPDAVLEVVRSSVAALEAGDGVS